MQDVANQMGLELRVVPGMTLKDLPALYNECTPEIVDFVYLVKHAAFVVTDSFHGTCFSVIFQRPFVSLVNEWRGAARYQIFRDMGLGSRLVYHPEKVLENLEALTTEPDFTLAQIIRQREREKAMAWLQSALGKKPKVSDSSLLYDYWRSERVALGRQVPRRRLAIQKIKNAVRRRMPTIMFKGIRKIWRHLRTRSRVVRLLKDLLG